MPLTWHAPFGGGLLEKQVMLLAGWLPYKTPILQKLGVRNRAQAAMRAREFSLVN